MKTLIAVSTAAMMVFAASAYAGDDCNDALVKVDQLLQTVKISDEAKARVLELREQAADQIAAGDKACSETLSMALQTLQQ